MVIHAAVNIGTELGSPWGVSLTTADLVNRIVTIGGIIAGIVLVYLFVFGGIKVISSAGSGDARGAEQGKKALTYALFGFIIVVFAYWIITFFQAITGTTFLTSP